MPWLKLELQGQLKGLIKIGMGRNALGMRNKAWGVHTSALLRHLAATRAAKMNSLW